jgi:hypothetical protein
VVGVDLLVEQESPVFSYFLPVVWKVEESHFLCLIRLMDFLRG